MSDLLPGRRIEISFLIDSDRLDQHELVAILGSVPDSGWKIGDECLVRGAIKRRDGSRWAAHERDDDVEDWTFTLDRLMSRLRALEAGLRALPPDVHARLMIAMTENNGVFGYAISREHISFLADIRAEIDLSFVVYRNPQSSS